MKIVLISAGLRPKRSGGLVAYVEELISGLRGRGHQVTYIDTGNFSMRPGSRVEKGGVAGEYKLINSGSLFRQYWKTSEPLRQIRCPVQFSRQIAALMADLKPDVIHVHEMLGFPAELIPLLKGLGYRLILTAQDYFTVCPTIRLVTISGPRCTFADADLTCKACCAGAQFLAEAQALELFNKLSQRGYAGKIVGGIGSRLASGIARWLQKHWVTDAKYIQRRKEFRNCLESFDRIVCMSEAQRAEMRRVLGSRCRLEVQYLSRRTYGTPSPRQANGSRGAASVIFLALNVTSREKGLQLLLESVERLRELAGRFEVHLYGIEGRDDQILKWKGPYVDRQLDEIAATADCAIIPSIWQEAYAYVGPEMLTRGVPLIVSKLGGMSEYVTHEQNGLIFDPDRPEALAQCMARLIENRDLLTALQNHASEPRSGIVGFEEHLDATEALYLEVIGETSFRTAGRE